MGFLRKAAAGAGLFALIAGLLPAAAGAAPSISVTTRYYPVSGATPLAVYSTIRSRGPKVGGIDAFATTTPHISGTGRAVMAGGKCRVDGFHLKIRFDVLLPKMRGDGLSGTAARDWAAFSQHMRAHEMHHVALWTECAREAEAAVSRVRAPTCGMADRQAAAVYAGIRKVCDTRHAAYDAAERRRLTGHAFMRKVLAGQSAQVSEPSGDVTRQAFSQPRRRGWFPFGQ